MSLLFVYVLFDIMFAHGLLGLSQSKLEAN
jgi:hypothetical protein